MAPMPPPCPRCSPPPMLWKDTTAIRPEAPDRWKWYCTGCTSYWEPTAQQKLEFTHGTPARPAHTLRTADA